MLKFLYIILFSAGLAMSGLSSASPSEEAKILKLRFAYGEIDSNGEPPYYYLNEDNKLVGVVVDLLTLAFAPRKVELTPVFAPRKRLHNLFRADEVDVDVMNEQWVPRSLPVVFSVMAYVDPHYIFTNVEQLMAFPNFDALKGKRQCAHRGYLYSKVQAMTDSGQMLRIDSNTDEQMLKMLAAGRCDVVVGSLSVTSHTINAIGLQSYIVRTELVDRHWDVQFMLNAKHAALIVTINRFLKRSDYPKIRARIMKKYLN